MATVLFDTPASTAYRAALDFLVGRVNYERQAVVPYREANFRLDRMHELARNVDVDLQRLHGCSVLR